MKNITITLGKDHLLILSDLLYRLSESDILNDFVVDEAELQALWHLEWLFEKNTSEILSRDYIDAVKDARNKYRHKN